MEQTIIDAVTAAGFDVYMRKPADTWLIFTDGKNVGYLQHDRLDGYTISTVHIPNTTTGTGFQVERHISKFDREKLRRAFIHYPDWHRGSAESVHKYKGIEDYIAANKWANYQLVAPARKEA